MGDTPPHGKGECPYRKDYQEEATRLIRQGVNIFTGICGNYPPRALLAHERQGVLLPLGNIEAIIGLLIGICMRKISKSGAFEQKLTSQGRHSHSKKNLTALLK